MKTVFRGVLIVSILLCATACSLHIHFDKHTHSQTNAVEQQEKEDARENVLNLFRSVDNE